MAQAGRVEPVGVAKLSGRGRRWRVIGPTLARPPRRTETRIVATRHLGSREGEYLCWPGPEVTVNLVN